jgi:RimJ/RimL family protein N-acetyltransferase
VGAGRTAAGCAASPVESSSRQSPWRPARERSASSPSPGNGWVVTADPCLTGWGSLIGEPEKLVVLLARIAVTLGSMDFLFETPPYDDGVVFLTGYGVGDVEEHLAGEDDETARRFGWWPQRSTAETVTAAFRSWAGDWLMHGPTRTFAARDGTGRLLGGCQLQRHQDGRWAVSYWTAAAHRRQGIATRALRLLLLYADRDGITQLECHVAEDNVGSRRVAEAAGFTDPSIEVETDGQVVVRYLWRRDDHFPAASSDPRQRP